MASALPSVPVPYDQPLRDLMRDWSPDDLRRALDHVDDAEEARHWLRAYLADRPREWLLLVFGEQFVGSLATEAHLALIRSIGEVMPYKLGRSAPPIALEEPRGFGKSWPGGDGVVLEKSRSPPRCASQRMVVWF